MSELKISQDKWQFDGSRAKERRKKRAMTQREVAHLLGVNQCAVCDYERGRSSPSCRTLARMASILRTSTDYLLGLTENPNPLHSVIALTIKESELLEAFYSLSEERRERAIGILIGLKENFGSK